MTLKQINAAIQRQQPNVELVRGEGYHYYVYDNKLDGSAIRFETESVMCPYLSHQSAETWISDGIAFGRKTEAA